MRSGSISGVSGSHGGSGTAYFGNRSGCRNGTVTGLVGGSDSIPARARVLMKNAPAASAEVVMKSRRVVPPPS